MANSDETYKIFISAAEPSSDEHCAALIKALKKTGPQALGQTDDITCDNGTCHTAQTPKNNDNKGFCG